MPIEVEVGKALRAKDAAADRLALRRGCREYAAKWVGIQREEFERLGVWGDWEHPYLTMDHAFEASILESFAGLAAKGFVQRGLRSIHWCPTDRTALAEAEIEYQDDASPSIHVAFPLRSDPRGNARALREPRRGRVDDDAVDAAREPRADGRPGGDVRRRARGRRATSSSPSRGSRRCAPRPRWTDAGIVERIPGSALVGAVFESPWGGDSRVVDGSPFVSMEDGTGLVHMAPGHGKEDFQVGARAGLAVLCPVDAAGTLHRGRGAVRRAQRARGERRHHRVARRARPAVASGTITHAYPHCWRCRQPVIFRATDQWFMIIDHDGHRDRALARIEDDVRWDPPGSQNRIRESVRGRPDWCLSRQRAWGVGIPAVYCEACDAALLDPRVMARAAEVTRAEGSDAWYEKPVSHFLPEGFTCTACGTPGSVPQGDRHPRRVVRLGHHAPRRARDAPRARRGVGRAPSATAAASPTSRVPTSTAAGSTRR